MASGDKFEEQEILVVADVPSRHTEGAGTLIRVVRWRVNGRLSKKPGLEKRSYYTKGGEKRLAGNRLVWEDVDFSAIKLKWSEIHGILTCPPPFVATKVSIAAGGSDGNE